MKKFIPYLILGILTSVMFACEENDTLEELGTSGNFAANIYFVPIEPIAFTESTFDTEVEYWSVGDEFETITMLQNVAVNDRLEFRLADASYTYRYEDTREVSEGEEIRTLQHRFTDYVPQKNAYVISPSYEVPRDFRKVTFNRNTASKSGMVGALPEEIPADFYLEIATNLSQQQLREILVNIHQVIDENTLQSYYTDGNLSNESLPQLVQKLNEIGIANLIADNYSYEQIYRVSLYFRIVNGLGEEAISGTRSFNVN